MNRQNSIEPLPSFLAHRYSPCVFVVVTKEVAEFDSGCALCILKAWDEVLHEFENSERRDKIEYRLIFPSGRRNLDTLRRAMGSMRTIFHSDGERSGFYFSNSPFSVSVTRELPTISFLRNKLFPYDLLGVDYYWDVPQTILIFTLGGEDFQRVLPQSHRPAWVGERMNAIPMNLVRYDKANLKGVLRSFLNGMITPRFRDALSACDRAFRERIVVKQVIDRVMQERGSFACDDCKMIKEYADYQMMAGNHRFAGSLYSTLMKHFWDRSRVEDLNAVLMGAVACDIITGEITENTVEMIETAKKNSKSLEVSLLLTLIHFWILPRIGAPSPEPLVAFLNVSDKTPFHLLVEPFLKEQILQFWNVRCIPFNYLYLADLFDANGYPQHRIRCLWNCWQVIKDAPCSVAQSYLLETIISFLVRQKNFARQPQAGVPWMFADDLGFLMRHSHLPKLPVLASYLSFSNPDKAYVCGFVTCSVISYSLENPIRSGPVDYHGDWFSISQKMCGAYVKDHFFSRDSLVTDEIGIGDVIQVVVRISNRCRDFPLTDCSIRTEGAKTICSRVNSDANETHECEFTLKAVEGGTIRLTGLNFTLMSNVKLFSLFKQTGLALFCEKDAPIVHLEERIVVYEMFTGDACVVPLILHVGEKPLSSLSLIIDGDSDVITLLSPRASDVGGQYFFGSIPANTDLVVSILLSAPHPGDFSTWLFFGYKSDDKLFRYQHFHSQLRVYEAPSLLPMFPSFSNWPMPVKISIRKLEAHTYQFMVRNPQKRPIHNITVEFLTDGIGSSYLLSGFTRRRFDTIKPLGAAAFCFIFESFNADAYPAVKLTASGVDHVSDLAIFLNHYQAEM